MSVFAEKLDGLPQTIRAAAADTDLTGFSEAIRSGAARIAYAVGSGGSAIAAHYLARCRRTLGFGQPTLVQTPLGFVLDDAPIAAADVWLFSAAGFNPDILAALDAALARGTRRIVLVTTTQESPLRERLGASGFGRILTTPTLGTKDGFLATHSLAAAVTGLLLAADLAGPSPRTTELVAEWIAAAESHLGRENRVAMRARFASMRRHDTLFVLHDPRLEAPALLLETCAWEAGLCPVQRTDFRNFAHGRHVWLAHRGPESVILALTGRETRPVWEDIARALPEAVRNEQLDAGGCGRFETAVALLNGLTTVEALGEAVEIDPGRPKAGDFAEALYEAPSLRAVSDALGGGIRTKAAATRERDHPAQRDLELAAPMAAYRATLWKASFRGLVLDYDGTLVTHDGRYDPMSPEIVAELTRLLDERLALAAATGRGGSAGEKLRAAIPERHWDHIIVSYYNGGHTEALRADLDANRPPPDSRLEPARAWLSRSPAFKPTKTFRDSHVQLTINIADLADEDSISQGFAAEGNPDGSLRLARSSHTLDICLAEACKTTAAGMLAERNQVSLDGILCIGDSGAVSGNDHALLGLPCGVSVGRVCDRLNAAWNLFDESVAGPDALLRILRGLRPGIDGHQLRIDALTGTGTNPKK